MSAAIRWFTALAVFMVMETLFASDKKHLNTPEFPQTHDIFFVNPTHGWILQDHSKKKRFLLRTSDGGTTWSSIGMHNHFLQIFFNDPQTGWAIAVDSSDKPTTVLYWTVDGGTSWVRRATVPNPEGAPGMIITKFRFLDLKHGWFVGQAGGGRRIVATTDDGGTFIKNVAEQLPGNDLLLGMFSEHERLWLLGRDSILASPDGGHTWKAQVSREHMIDGLGSILLNSGLIFEDGIGWAAGDAVGPVIVGTTDFGEHWHAAFEAKDGFFTDISFGDHLHGCAVTIDTRVFCTSDSGHTWHRVTVPLRETSNNPLRAFFENKIRFSDPNHLWLIAHNGTLYHSNDAGQNWHKVELP